MTTPNDPYSSFAKDHDGEGTEPVLPPLEEFEERPAPVEGEFVAPADADVPGEAPAAFEEPAAGEAAAEAPVEAASFEAPAGFEAPATYEAPAVDVPAEAPAYEVPAVESPMEHTSYEAAAYEAPSAYEAPAANYEAPASYETPEAPVRRSYTAGMTPDLPAAPEGPAATLGDYARSNEPFAETPTYAAAAAAFMSQNRTDAPQVNFGTPAPAAPSFSETAPTTVAPAAPVVPAVPVPAAPEPFLTALSPEAEQERAARWQDPGVAPVDPSTTVPAAPKGRAGWHVGSFFLTLLLLPCAWYVLRDGSVRIINSPDINWAAIGELLGGGLIALVLFLIAQRSAFGAIFFGALVSVTSLVALCIPDTTHSILQNIDDAIGSFNDFTGNLTHHLTFDMLSGEMFMFGMLLLAAGIAAAGARRQGQARGTILGRRAAAGLA